MLRYEEIEEVRAALKTFAGHYPEVTAWCHRIRDNLRRLAIDPDDRALRVQTMKNIASLEAALSSREGDTQ